MLSGVKIVSCQLLICHFIALIMGGCKLWSFQIMQPNSDLCFALLSVAFGSDTTLNAGSTMPSCRSVFVRAPF